MIVISLTPPDMACNQPFDMATHNIMCLVKRHAYKVSFTLPHVPHAMSDEAQLRLHVQVRGACQAGEFGLSLGDTERLYEDLRQIIEYWQTERQKSRRSKPVS
jgi:hypothetical protein